MPRKDKLKKEKERINGRHFEHPLNSHAIPEYDSAEHVMREANEPYKPKCEASLANRIMRCSEKVSLHSRIRHMTSSVAIDDILQDSLKAHQLIYTGYSRVFMKAALSHADAQNGGAKAISFGFDVIDPKTHGDYGFELDLKAVIAQNPAAFYKVRDFAYFDDDSFQEVSVKGSGFRFTCTQKGRAHKSEESLFIFKSESFRGQRPLVSSIANELLTSHDLQKLDQIITLNFFRFVDALYYDGTKSRATAEINGFYKQLESLTDEELTAFLEDVGRKISKTGEFDFHGSYTIDFDTLVSLGCPDTQYSIDMANLIAAFNEEKFEVIWKAFACIPQVFFNHRFCDYLLENKVTNKKSRNLIGFLRKKHAHYYREFEKNGDACVKIEKACTKKILKLIPKVKVDRNVALPRVAESAADEGNVPLDVPSERKEADPVETANTRGFFPDQSQGSVPVQEKEFITFSSKDLRLKHSLIWGSGTFAVTGAVFAAAFVPAGFYAQVFSQFLGGFPGGVGGFMAILTAVAVVAGCVAGCVAGVVASRKGSSKGRSSSLLGRRSHAADHSDSKPAAEPGSSSK